MNIHEYQAKQLFERFGVATPKGIAAATAQEAAQTARNMGLSQYVVKAQVHAGGRGKGTFKNGFKGGVHVVKSVEEVEEVAGKMLNQVLVTKQTGETGKLVSKIMVAEAVDLKKECYFAILQDRARECPVIVASTEGGMDIEEVAGHPAFPGSQNRRGAGTDRSPAPPDHQAHHQRLQAFHRSGLLSGGNQPPCSYHG